MLRYLHSHCTYWYIRCLPVITIYLWSCGWRKYIGWLKITWSTHTVAATTIRGRHLFRSSCVLVWLLFKGGVYSRKYRNKLVLTWIQTNAICKGRPNMMAASSQQYLNTKVFPDIWVHHPNIPEKTGLRTSACWLHNLGFYPSKLKEVCMLMVTSVQM